MTIPTSPRPARSAVLRIRYAVVRKLFPAAYVTGSR
jgi:hypothetical protein